MRSVEKPGGTGAVRPILKRLRRNLGDDANNPRYRFNELRIGYRMATGETQGTELPGTL